MDKLFNKKESKRRAAPLVCLPTGLITRDAPVRAAADHGVYPFLAGAVGVNAAYPYISMADLYDPAACLRLSLALQLTHRQHHHSSLHFHHRPVDAGWQGIGMHTGSGFGRNSPPVPVEPIVPGCEKGSAGILSGKGSQFYGKCIGEGRGVSVYCSGGTSALHCW